MPRKSDLPKPTADLCDAHGDAVRVCEPLFSHFGGKQRFAGRVRTVLVFEDNSRVRELLQQDGNGQVLVVQGGGSKGCALLGGNLGALAVKNNWAGLLINGCVRDAAELWELELGVCALATHPRKSRKRGTGEVDVVVHFAGVTFCVGDYLYADADGVVVAAQKL